MKDSDKRLRLVARRCFDRLQLLEQRVYRDSSKVLEKRHLIRDTEERHHYTAGYLQALKDLRVLLSEGVFPDNEIESEGRSQIPLSEHTGVGQMCLSCSSKEAAPCVGIVPLCLDCVGKMSNPRGVVFQSDPEAVR